MTTLTVITNISVVLHMNSAELTKDMINSLRKSNHDKDIVIISPDLKYNTESIIRFSDLFIDNGKVIKSRTQIIRG